MEPVHEPLRIQSLIETQALRIAMLEAEMRFVEQLVHDIRSGELPGVTTWATLHDLLAEGHTAEEIFADPIRYLGEEGRALTDLPTVTPT